MSNQTSLGISVVVQGDLNNKYMQNLSFCLRQNVHRHSVSVSQHNFFHFHLYTVIEQFDLLSLSNGRSEPDSQHGVFLSLTFISATLDCMRKQSPG